MNENDLPANVRGLIQSSVPTLDALEILIVLVGRPGAAWTVSEIVANTRAMVTPELTIKHHLQVFHSQGLVAPVPGERYQFSPATQELSTAVAGLCKAYNERPVTLIRTLYEIADSKKIQSFADAFRLKKDR